MILFQTKYLFFSLTVIILAVVIVVLISSKLFYSRPQVSVLSTPMPLPSHFMYGVNVEMSQILPSSVHYVKNSRGEDLIDIASHLGITVFRITNSTRSKNDQQDAIYTKAEWDMVLNKMQSKGIKAIIQTETASNNPDLYNRTIQPAYLQLVQKYLLDSDVLSHSDVYAVDIDNEPILTPHNISMLQQAAQMIKQQYPHMPVTVGWWGMDTGKKDQNGNEIYTWDDYSAGKQLNPFVDFYSLHMYGYDEPKFGIYPNPYFQTMKFLFQVKAGLQTKKPIFIEEFGSANGDAISDQDTLGSPEQQATVFDGIYKALQDMHDKQIIGAAVYQFYSRDQNPDAWAIAKNHGNYLFPAAYVLQKHATGTSDISLSLPYSSTPNDYILKNEDNDKTITVSSNEIIGLDVQLPRDSYVLVTDANGLSVSEQLRYRQDEGAYNAVFHAVKPGTYRAAIAKVPRCNTKKTSCVGKAIFRLNVIVKG